MFLNEIRKIAFLNGVVIIQQVVSQIQAKI
jgi:hypothetical protein